MQTSRLGCDVWRPSARKLLHACRSGAVAAFVSAATVTAPAAATTSAPAGSSGDQRRYQLETTAGPTGGFECRIRPLTGAQRSSAPAQDASATRQRDKALSVGTAEQACSAISRARAVGACLHVDNQSVGLCRAEFEQAGSEKKPSVQRLQAAVELVQADRLKPAQGRKELVLSVPLLAPDVLSKVLAAKGLKPDWHKGTAIARAYRRANILTVPYDDLKLPEGAPCPFPGNDEHGLGGRVAKTVPLLVGLKNGRPALHCSSVVVGLASNQYLLTAAHCVDGFDVFFRHADGLPAPLSCKCKGSEPNACKDHRKDHDLAVCQLPNTYGQGAAALASTSPQGQILLAGYGRPAGTSENYGMCAGYADLSASNPADPTISIAVASSTQAKHVLTVEGDSGGPVLVPPAQNSPNAPLAVFGIIRDAASSGANGATFKFVDLTKPAIRQWLCVQTGQSSC